MDIFGLYTTQESCGVECVSEEMLGGLVTVWVKQKNLITTKCPKNFVIILGSPGIYDPEDPGHDQSWRSFFVTLQVAFQKKILTIDAQECVTWIVYEKGYNTRWEDDKNSERATQQKDANDYPQGYSYKIMKWVTEQGHQYLGANSANDVYESLKSLRDNSLTRLIFTGHASHALWLDLVHHDDHKPYQNVYLENENLVNSLINKTDSSLRKPSILLGCNTANVAKLINQATKLVTEGSNSKISFIYLETDKEDGNPDGKIIEGDVLERIKNGKVNGISPNWERFE